MEKRALNVQAWFMITIGNEWTATVRDISKFGCEFAMGLMAWKNGFTVFFLQKVFASPARDASLSIWTQAECLGWFLRKFFLPIFLKFWVSATKNWKKIPGRTPDTPGSFLDTSKNSRGKITTGSEIGFIEQTKQRGSSHHKWQKSLSKEKLH